MTISRTLLAILALAVALVAPTTARADGGALIASEVAGPYRVSVFIDPGTPRAGPADVSVLVQDAKSNVPVPEATVTLGIAPIADETTETRVAWVPPCCSIDTAADLSAVPATFAAAENKLLRAAHVLIPTSGSFRITTTVSSQAGTAVVPAFVSVAPPASPLTSYWPFLAFPPITIVLFALQQRIRHKG